jgi:hypothetical protein
VADDTPKPSVFEDGGALPDWAQDGNEVTDAPVEEVTNLDDVEVEPVSVDPTPAVEVSTEEAQEPTSEETTLVAEPTAAETTDVPALEPSPVEGAESVAESAAEIDWEKRYGDLFRTRQSEVEQNRRVAAERDQLQQALAQALPALQQMAEQRRKPTPEQLEQAGIDPSLYEQVEPLINARVAEREQAIRAEMSQAETARAERDEQAAIHSAALSFMQEKGIEVESEDDVKVGTFIQVFANRLAEMGYRTPDGQPDIDLTDRSTFEIAYEAVKSPAFGREMLANPHFFYDDDSVALARERAALMQGVKPATTQPAVASKTPLPTVTKAGGAGNPVSGSPLSDDPLADAKALVAEESKSVFG